MAAERAVDPAARSARAVDPVARLQHALDLAYGYLGRRDRTVAQMRRHLEGARVDAVTIDVAIGELEHQGYLDDARFARRFAEDRRALDGWGGERIERRLRESGVAPELVASVVADREAADELQAATDVLRRRLMTAPRSARERDRALGILVRKGYDLELAYDAVRAFERDH